MDNINKLTFTFVDGQTTINQNHLNSIVNTINQLIDVVGGDTPTPSTVAKPQISISGSTAIITCSTSGATIRYAINGTPTESSGTIIANGGTVNLSSYSQSTVIRAIAYKSGMTTSQVAQETYSPSISPEAQAALAKFSNLSSTQQTKVKNLVDTLVSGGIYSKIHYLSFPTMAANVPEAVQNILSDVTPPTVETGVVNNGLFTAESVDLTDMLVGNIDYDNYSLAYSVQLNAEQTGSTATIMRLNSTVSGTASRVFQNVGDSPKVNFTGYKANGHSVAADSTSAVFTQINSHDKANSVEKWFDVNGQLTSDADGDVIPTNNGLSINTDGTATTYNVKFVGKYRFILLSDCLTDTQLNTLKTAIDTFLS